MNYIAEVREIKEQTVYYKDYFISNMNRFFQELKDRNIFQELSDKVLRENPGVELTDPDYNFLLYISGEYKEENALVEFCDAVTKSGVDTDEYKFKLIPDILSVNIIHKGRYEELSEAYNFAYGWIENNGYEKNGCPRSSAIDGFWNCDSEEDYITEIQIPVKKL